MPTNFILRKKHDAPKINVGALRIFSKYGLTPFQAAGAFSKLRKSGAVVVRFLHVENVIEPVRDLERYGIWAQRYGSKYRPFYPVPFENWKIGMEFWCGPGFPFRVTDVGSRTITAIHLNTPNDPSWYNGPPYAIEEIVFDENDLQSCYLEEPTELNGLVHM